jgi:cytochrome c553
MNVLVCRGAGFKVVEEWRDLIGAVVAAISGFRCNSRLTFIRPRLDARTCSTVHPEKWSDSGVLILGRLRCRSVIFWAVGCLGFTTISLAQDEARPAFKSVDSIEARVQGCVTCHGQSGQGTSNGYFPRIAGKPAGYLYNQLIAFRDGTRQYPPMNYLVAYLPDPYLREIAEHFAKQRPAFIPTEQVTADKASQARGQVLALAGDSGKQIPACVACHGIGLTGMQPGIPALAGLRSTYIVAQLTRWRVGDRRAAEPDCMKRIASRLSETDVTAVAVWLSQQPPPRDSSPELSNLTRMPVACGSQR